jgi:hypothetical protein
MLMHTRLVLQSRNSSNDETVDQAINRVRNRYRAYDTRLLSTQWPG